jgi:parallel beta-helix repeat protein
VLSDSAKGNRIQDNTLIDNNTGLLIQGVTNILVQNRASSSAVTNWAIMDGNLSHHWVSNVTNSWPWVNLSY